MRVWKVLGIAGIAGVATTAAVVQVRRRRAWTEVEPSELRDRLHARLDETTAGP